MAGSRTSRQVRTCWGGVVVAAGAIAAVVALGAAPGLAGEPMQTMDAEGRGPLKLLGGATRCAEDPHSGRACYLAEGHRELGARRYFRVDPTKTYRLTGWFKSAGKTPSLIYVGFGAYTAKKRWIRPQEVNCVQGTETALSAACLPEDTVIKIADGGSWKTSPHAAVAFKVDASGGFRDLPNRNLSSTGVTKVGRKGDHWEVHLAKPCGKTYPAGTKVREQMAAGSYIYAAGSHRAPATWTRFSGTVKGMASSTSPKDAWWPGTVFGRVAILANFRQKKEVRLLIDDVTVEELPTPPAKHGAK